MRQETDFWHDKLEVYQRTLAFVSRVECLIAASTVPAAALGHLERAAESIAENIVNGNVQWSPDAKCQYLNVARGSALECAACLDVCCIKGVLLTGVRNGAKQELRDIVGMLVGLMRSHGRTFREEAGQYDTGAAKRDLPYFDHERLEVYHFGLGFVGWVDANIRESTTALRRCRKLDELATSIVLNVAEGNGRSEDADHRNFIDIAHRSAIKAALQLDLIAAKGQGCSVDTTEGKRALGRIARMLIGMRGYFKAERGDMGRP